MGKTKAEIIAEYRDLKKENLKLTNQLEHWKAIARKENDRVVDLAQKLDESEKEKTLIKSQRDVLLKEAEEHLYQINDLQESFDILQAEVRKIQINEETIHDHAYEEGFNAARNNYQDALTSSNKELRHFIEKCRRLEWEIGQIYENQTK